MAATNGPSHLVELYEIEQSIFGAAAKRHMVETFGSVTGGPQLADHFSNVVWLEHDGGLICTDPMDVLRYFLSSPPSSIATEAELVALRTAVDQRFEQEGGVLRVTIESGVYLATLK
jgi:hypothetical protein